MSERLAGEVGALLRSTLSSIVWKTFSSIRRGFFGPGGWQADHDTYGGRRTSRGTPKLIFALGDKGWIHWAA